MTSDLLLIFALISTCVAIHSLAIWQGTRAIRRISLTHEKTRRRPPAAFILTATVCALFVLHLLHVFVWAIAYSAKGFFESFADSMYYSAASYSTVGYGDLVIEGPGRFFGPFEAMTGVLMFGWSTGIIVLIATRLYADLLNPERNENRP